MPSMLHLLLASQSPRRRELLGLLGIPFTTLKIEVDETQSLAHSPERHIHSLVITKAQAALKELNRPLKDDEILLTADTLLVFEGKIIGKPKDYQDFKKTLNRLSGKSHQVLSAIFLKSREKEAFRLNQSKVKFASLSHEFIDYYWQTGEPQDKAGGYAIQGLMAPFIEYIHGSYHGIMGLPLYELQDALHEMRYNYLHFLQEE